MVRPYVKIKTNINLYISSIMFFPTINSYPIQKDTTYQLYIEGINGHGIQLQAGAMYVFRVDTKLYVVKAISYSNNNDNTVEMFYIISDPRYVGKLSDDILYIVEK